MDKSSPQKVKWIKNNITFFEAMKEVSVVGQLLGLMPMEGLHEDNPHGLKFNLKGLIAIYSLIILCILGFFEVCALCHLLTVKISRGTKDVMRGIGEEIVGPVLNTCLIVTVGLYMRLAAQWPIFICEWWKMDHKFNYATSKKRLCTHFLVWISVATGGVILSIINGYNFCQLNRAKCGNREQAGNFFYDYAVSTHPFVFSDLIQYNNIIGTANLFLNIYSVYAMAYQDCFIMMVSIGIADRFNQFNRRLSDSQRSLGGMERFRMERIALSKLSRKFDENANGIVFLTLIRNFFIICTLLMTFTANRDDRNGVAKIKDIYDLTTTFLRLMSVAYHGMQINDGSHGCLSQLYSVRNEAYNAQAEKLIVHARYNESCLTGLRYITLNRAFFFTILGLLLTFEVLVLQFNSI